MRKNKTGMKLAVLTASVLMVFLCPFTVSAASLAAADIQDWAVETFLITKVEVEQKIPYMHEITKYSDSSDLIQYPLDIDARGASKIDVTVKATDSRYASDNYLMSGNTVIFALRSDNSSDSFQAGIEDSGQKKTYVTSSEGCLIHTIKVDKSDNYTIFIGRTASNSVHIVGSITIFD